MLTYVYPPKKSGNKKEEEKILTSEQFTYQKELSDIVSIDKPDLHNLDQVTTKIGPSYDPVGTWDQVRTKIGPSYDPVGTWDQVGTKIGPR